MSIESGTNLSSKVTTNEPFSRFKLNSVTTGEALSSKNVSAASPSSSVTGMISLLLKSATKSAVKEI